MGYRHSTTSHQARESQAFQCAFETKNHKKLLIRFRLWTHKPRVFHLLKNKRMQDRPKW
ncbi:hypothetical protein HAL07_04760 [Helicobacter ailurogastricus]|uniref:Uncharacterized protein n=1 Tax=Helicobacter ailurogastricus TaxID=1578720 RepID=A0A0K2Y5F5_9HELI|nr:hypothetical protein HAL07_04760 [Helicobacter ailurogastricus]